VPLLGTACVHITCPSVPEFPEVAVCSVPEVTVTAFLAASEPTTIELLDTVVTEPDKFAEFPKVNTGVPTPVAFLNVPTAIERPAERFELTCVAVTVAPLQAKIKFEPKPTELEPIKVYVLPPPAPLSLMTQLVLEETVTIT